MLLTWEANYIFLQAEKLICEGHGCNVLIVFDFFFEVRKTRGGPRVRFIYLQPHTVGFNIKNTKTYKIHHKTLESLIYTCIYTMKVQKVNVKYERMGSKNITILWKER